MANMNNVQSQKCGYPPEAIEENAVKNEKSRVIFRRLRELLKVAERVLTLVERLKKNGGFIALI